MRLIPLVSLGIVMLGSIFLVGCGNSGATIEGKVRYKGAPLTTGSVTFNSDGVIRTASIDKDGTYRIQDCPPGEVKIAIAVHVVKVPTTPPAGAAPPKVNMPGKPGTPEQNAVAPVQIDAKYQNANTSGLTYPVQAGTQSYDIDLK